MKRIALLTFISLFGIITFTAFLLERKVLINEINTEVFKLDTWGFIIGILSLILLPYSLLLLFIRKKNFRGSLAWGWLAGIVLIVLIIILSFSLDEFKFLY